MTALAKSPKDALTGLLFLAFGGAFLWIAQDYQFGTARRMGPSFFPTILSIVLMAIGAATLIRSLWLRGEPITGVTWTGLVLVLGASVLFGVLVRSGGLAVSVVAMVLVSAWASRSFRWLPTLIMATGLAVFSSLVFVKALGLPIPILGPWLGG